MNRKFQISAYIDENQDIDELIELMEEVLENELNIMVSIKMISNGTN